MNAPAGYANCDDAFARKSCKLQFASEFQDNHRKNDDYLCSRRNRRTAGLEKLAFDEMLGRSGCQFVERVHGVAIVHSSKDRELGVSEPGLEFGSQPLCLLQPIDLERQLEPRVAE